MHSLLNNFKFWDFFTANKIRKCIYRIFSTTTPDNESSAKHRVALIASIVHSCKTNGYQNSVPNSYLNKSTVLAEI